MSQARVLTRTLPYMPAYPDHDAQFQDRIQFLSHALLPASREQSRDSLRTGAIGVPSLVKGELLNFSGSAALHRDKK